MAGCGKVNPNLVGPPGQGSDFDESSVGTGLEEAETGFGLFAVTGSDHHLSGCIRVQSQLLVAGPLLLARDPVDDGHIHLFHFPTLEQGAEGPDRPGTLRQEQDAASLGIEPMNKTQEFEVAGAGPEVASLDGRNQGGLEIAAGS